MKSARHETWVKRHSRSCARGSACSTRYEAHCACGFGQGANCHEQADAICFGHRANPAAPVISWESGPPLTAATITKQDLQNLFARHCECRPLDLERVEGDHAAIHACDTGILSDIQYALGFVQFNDIGRIQAIHEALGRCADIINAARKGQ
jgi:hypothetical protein